MNSIAEILFGFSAYEQDLRDTLNTLGDAEASPETLESAAHRVRMAGVWLEKLSESREVLSRLTQEEREQLLEAEGRVRELRALLTSAAAERAGEIASSLEHAGSQLKRLDGYRNEAESSGGSCNLSA